MNVIMMNQKGEWSLWMGSLVIARHFTTTKDNREN